MKTLLLLLALCALSLPVQAQQNVFEDTPEPACYAEYKARKGPPLKLHYGVIALEGAACERRRAAKRIVAERISVDDWELLKIMDVFVVGDTVTRREFRKKEADAGRFFLRY